MDGIESFLTMGGHGAYIWPAYLIAAGVLIALLVDSLRSTRNRESQLTALRQMRRGGGETT